MGLQVEIIRRLGVLKDLAPAGYALALHVRMVSPTILAQTYPKEWLDLYNQRGFLMQDPTVLWGFENVGMIRWTDLVARDSAGILALSATYGMKFGVTYVTDTNQSQTLSSFTRGDRDFTEEEMAAIRDEVEAVHDLTRGLDKLAPETLAALRKLSIICTHPGG